MYWDKKNEIGFFVVFFILFILEVFGMIYFCVDVKKFFGFDWIVMGLDGFVLFYL